MMEFSAKRRILGLWLPRLSTDRLQRQWKRAGVPDNTPPEKLTPVGNVPTSEIVGVGKPLAVTVNVPRVPVAKIVLFALVMAGA